MPAQPARDRLWGRVDKKDALPGDEHIVKPHLAVELVEPAAERRAKRVAVARSDLAAERRGSGRVDRQDQTGAMPADLDAREGADIDILGIGRTRMHAELAADDDPASLSRTSSSATRWRGSGRIRWPMIGAPPQ